jgi:hypothetical protein
MLVPHLLLNLGGIMVKTAVFAKAGTIRGKDS